MPGGWSIDIELGLGLGVRRVLGSRVDEQNREVQLESGFALRGIGV